MDLHPEHPAWTTAAVEVVDSGLIDTLTAAAAAGCTAQGRDRLAHELYAYAGTDPALARAVVAAWQHALGLTHPAPACPSRVPERPGSLAEVLG